MSRTTAPIEHSAAAKEKEPLKKERPVGKREETAGTARTRAAAIESCFRANNLTPEVPSFGQGYNQGLYSTCKNCCCGWRLLYSYGTSCTREGAWELKSAVSPSRSPETFTQSLKLSGHKETSWKRKEGTSK
ncbi:Hypothetical predicted protein [Podarcis lilfordi]|uniref:Uncharacterized protein n=1 Tax=Podarcis lilfordi TaxID=74358 RepID=A0AA35KCB5_9SAUR|nr:Hypothetical predicted protein [Podarcis lilfordi]